MPNYGEEDYSQPQPMQWANIMDKSQGSQPLNATPFVDALKKRLNHPMMKQGGDMTGGKVVGDMGVGKAMSGSGGGAPTSLG